MIGAQGFSWVAVAEIMMGTKPTILELTREELEDVLRRAEAKQLGDEDCDTIRAVFLSYVHLTELLKDKNTSIARLRKMLFGASTEKTEAVIGRGTDSEAATSGEEGERAQSAGGSPSETALEDDPAASAKGHGRNGADAYHGAEKIEVPHPSLRPGDACPDCGQGTVYEMASGVLVRITGRAPVETKVYQLQKLRCNLCGKVFTAPAPEGVGPAKYDATVGSVIALLKYGSGMPFNRLEGLQGSLGIPLPASTQWDIVHAQAKHLEPIYGELLRQAGQGDVVYNDDTTVRILEMMGKRAKATALAEESVEGAQEKTGKRSGLFTSGIVSTVEGRRIALFFSGRKHAGENLKDVLAQRAAELAPPIQMCDGLSRNVPAELTTILANCLAHGRRQFVDVADSFPEACRRVLESLSVIYRNDAIARKRNLSPEARRAFHQAESGPTMEELHTWLTRQLDDRLVEPNSGLGGAITYLLKRWKELTLFLRVSGAPLDNNICERALKKAILHRKNALFYKTAHGARVGDLFMSLIYTCELCGSNPFDYLTELERHAAELASAPQDWMPWNYRQTLAALTTPSRTAP